METLLKRISILWQILTKPGANLSYSQEGEDMVLSRYFEGQKSGFYVDVGAHHPSRFSNTFKSYMRGWSGINIDATPGSMRAFSKVRSRDINLEIAIGESNDGLHFYEFNEPALNSFTTELSRFRDQDDSPYRIVAKTEVPTRPLSEVLQEHLPDSVEIDFLSVDVEGMDFEVLRSNDWDRFRPRLVLVELLESNLDAVNNNSLTEYLAAKGYRIYAMSVNTVFYELSRGS